LNGFHPDPYCVLGILYRRPVARSGSPKIGKGRLINSYRHGTVSHEEAMGELLGQ